VVIFGVGAATVCAPPVQWVQCRAGTVALAASEATKSLEFFRSARLPWVEPTFFAIEAKIALIPDVFSCL
jgi:hypothetical protein